MPKLAVEPGSDRWFALHLGRVSASRAAGCLRRNPHQGPRAAFNEIMGITHRGANIHMEHGIKNEQNAREAFYNRGRSQGWLTTLHPESFWIHDEHDWLCGTPDGICDQDATVDFKCPTIHMPEALPEAHEIQIRLQMALCNLPNCHYFAWREVGAPFHVYLERDLAIEAELIRDLKAWYEAWIVPSIAPPVRGPRKEKCNGIMEKGVENGMAVDLHTGPGSPEDGPGDG